MTELKTLKDLDFEECMYNTIPAIDEEKIQNLLRQEAIKWIKWLFEEAKKSKPDSHEEQCAAAQAHILIQFFNISEEDLK
jgi:hypothetical protein